MTTITFLERRFDGYIADQDSGLACMEQVPNPEQEELSCVAGG